MLSSSLERTLQAALALASAHRHEYATLEHLLLALLDDADAQMALRACHTDLAELRARPPISESARGWDCETGILLSGVAP